MDDQKPSTSRGAEGNQATLDESLEDTQTASASSGGNSTMRAPSASGHYDFLNLINKWFTSIDEEHSIMTSCEENTSYVVKNTGIQWLSGQWRSSNYFHFLDTKPKPATDLITIEQRPKPVYWWQREQFGKSPTVSAPSSDVTSSGPSDECAMEISENGSAEKKCNHLDIPSEASMGYHRKFLKEQNPEKNNQGSCSDSARSLSVSPWGSERLTQTSSSKKTSPSPSTESPLMEFPESLFLKCKPRPRTMSEPPVSAASSPEGEVPHCILSYDANDEFLRSSKKRCSGSAERKSRSLEREQITHSAERERINRPAERNRLSRSSFTLSQPELRSDSCSFTKKRQPRRESSGTRMSGQEGALSNNERLHWGPDCLFRPNLRRLFKSEDNLIRRVADRGHVAYCSCLCVWYRMVKEYKKISDGIRRMNRENR